MSARTPSVALALATLLALALPAKAFIVPPAVGTVQALMECDDNKIYSAQSRDVPSNIAASFSGQGAKLTFRTCHDAENNIHYFLREPRPNRNGVCRTLEKEVFPGSETEGVGVQLLYDGTAENWYFILKGWKPYPPQPWTVLHYPARSQEFGFVTDGDCPSGDDARYMELTNVTDGTLKSFSQFWNRIAAAPQSLRAAIATLPAHAAPIERFNTPEGQQRLRDRIVAAGKGEALQLLMCDSGGCRAFFKSFEVTFDIGPKGIVLTGVAALWQA